MESKYSRVADEDITVKHEGQSAILKVGDYTFKYSLEAIEELRKKLYRMLQTENVGMALRDKNGQLCVRIDQEGMKQLIDKIQKAMIEGNAS